MFWALHLVTEHKDIVRPVVMEMWRGVHAKFIYYNCLILPSVGKTVLLPLYASVWFENGKELCFYCNDLLTSNYSIVLYFFDAQDTGISVRKRVIKILRDICLEQPTFSKITEMCVKMIRRVNDEEGIKVWISYIYLSFFFTFIYFLFIIVRNFSL